MNVLTVPGLEQDVDILIDRWGIPHIYARTRPDLFLAQGFNVARDRLWQIDLWRKRGLGLLARDFGPAYVESDRAARLLLYRGDIAAEWAAYGPESESVFSSFVAGINAYVALVEREPNRMPQEFRMIGVRPHAWRADDCVRIRSHAKLFNFDSEITRANVAARFGLEADRIRCEPGPGWSARTSVVADLEPVPDEVLCTYRRGTELPSLGLVDIATGFGGSNAWAVAGSRTATGRPILASDPHRALQHPSLRYISHLNAPGLNVIGAGEPAIPGVSLGHNEKIAFGLTVFPADQADLFVYETDPSNPSRYRYNGTWESFTRIVEEIEVAGSASVSVALDFTKHGPVLHADESRCRAYSLGCVWWSPGSAAYCSSLKYLAASDWTGFQRAVEGWGVPPVNHIYADAEGNIGWVTAGFIPSRSNSDGLLPAKGDGCCDWDGYMDARCHPRLFNPAQGWVATSNQFALPPEFDLAKHKPGYEWPDAARYERVREALDNGAAHSLATMCDLQTDVKHMHGPRLLALIEKIDNPLIAPAKKLFEYWDFCMGPDSAPAALFEIWLMFHLARAWSDVLAPGAFASFDIRETSGFDTANMVILLEKPDGRYGATPVKTRDDILVRSLSNAWEDMIGRLGPDPSRWSWGQLHQVLFEHPLATLNDAPSLNVGPTPRGGSGLTVGCTDYRREDLRVHIGASFRMVLDVGEWDNSVVINAPGQSGESEGPHYNDLFEHWAKNDYVPMLFSRERIERETVLRIKLIPA